MSNNKQTISKEDALAALRLALYTLLRKGMSPERLVDHLNALLGELTNTEEIKLLSSDLPGVVSEEHIMRTGDITFDYLRRSVRYHGQRVDLSPKMNSLMELFMSKPGIAITHEEITEHVYEENPQEYPATACRTIISRLRDRLATLSGREDWIETVRGVGYVFTGEQKQ